MIRLVQGIKRSALIVRASEKIVLRGPSGSGKSTLLRCINHLESCEEGRILVGRICLTDDANTFSAIWLEVDMTSQQFNFNLAFPYD
jgi:ABC-type polar amino acid transport system ATPase subunit